MGYAKYAEDDNEIRENRLRWYDPHSYDSLEAEEKVIHNYQLETEKSSFFNDKEQRCEYLYSIRKSLEYRINLLMSLNTLQSTLFKFRADAYKKKMQYMNDEVNRTLSGYSYRVPDRYTISVEQRIEYKKSLISQMIMSVSKSIDQISSISSENMKLILTDLQALKEWYEDNGTFQCHLTASKKNTAELLKFLSGLLNRPLEECHNCGNMKVFKFCTYCGKSEEM